MDRWTTEAAGKFVTITTQYMTDWEPLALFLNYHKYPEKKLSTRNWVCPDVYDLPQFLTCIPINSMTDNPGVLQGQKDSKKLM